MRSEFRLYQCEGRKLKQPEYVLMLLAGAVLAIGCFAFFSRMDQKEDPTVWYRHRLEVVQGKLNEQRAEAEMGLFRESQTKEELERLILLGEEKEVIYQELSELDRIQNPDTELELLIQDCRLTEESKADIWMLENMEIVYSKRQKYEYLLEHGIPLAHSIYEPTLWNFLFLLLKSGIPLLAILVPVAAVGSGFVREIENRELKLLLLMPYRRSEIFLSKTLCLYGYIVLWMLLFLGTGAGVAWLLNGAGAGNYPVECGNPYFLQEKGVAFAQISDIVGFQLLRLPAYLLFSEAFCLMAGALSGNLLAAMAMAAAGLFFLLIVPMGSWQPLTCLNPDRWLERHMDFIGTQWGITVGWAILLIFLAIVIFRKREYEI